MPSRIIRTLTTIVITFVEFVLVMRIILKLFGARSAAPFAAWVYETSKPLLAPFEGIFPSPQVEGGFVIEFSALFALVVYAFISYVVNEIMDYMEAPQKTTTTTTKKEV